MDHSAKILLLGKTGVGKSAFVNYFLGRKVAESAAGKPVTQEYFIPYEIENGRYPIKIFDTKGLETLDADNQLNEIIEGIKERNNSDDIFDWFHTIFYCVSMSKPRFESFESNLIKRLQQELTQHIHIILTHCDTCKADEIRQMRNRITTQLGDINNIEIFEVVCVNKEKLSGEVVQARGREAVSERVFDLLLEDIAYKVSLSYASSLRKAMNDGADFALLEAEKFINTTVTFATLIEAIQDTEGTESRLDTYLEQIGQDIEIAINNTNHKFFEILQPVAQLYTSYWSTVTESFVEDIHLDFESFVNMDDFLDEKLFYRTLLPNMYKKGYLDEEDNLIDSDNVSLAGALKVITVGLGDLLCIKKNLKKFCRKTHEQFINAIPSETELQKKVYEQIVNFIRPKVFDNSV